MSVIALPELRIEVDGVPLSAEWRTSLHSVRVHQQLSLPTLCELIFRAPPDTISLRLDSDLRLEIKDQSIPLFVGQITALQQRYLPNSQRELRVRAYDPIHVLRKRQSVCTHIQVTPQELAQQFVLPLGLIVDSAESPPLYPYLIQHHQTDFDFLCEHLERCGLYFTVREGTLHLLTLAGLAETIPLQLGRTLLEAEVESNRERTAQAITAQGWNPALMESFGATVRQPRSGRQLPISMRENSSAEFWLVDQALIDPLQIEAIAQAELDERVSAEITLWGVARGDTALQPGNGIFVTGLADEQCGRYLLTQVTHRLDSQLGFVSELSTALPLKPPRPRGTIATLGVVTQVDDPDGMGRVRVKLPTYNDLESDWLQVVSSAAGVNKGLIALPGVEDNVLVLFVRENPAQGVILGGIYGPYAPYDAGVADGNVKRYTLRTPEGHFIRLDDEHKTVRLEDSHGNYVEMTPEKVTLFADCDLELRAPGRNIVIRGGHIDFQSG